LAREWSVPVGSGDATPALVDGKLYVFTRQEGDEVILCLDAASGKEIWRDKYASPAIEGGPAKSHRDREARRRLRTAKSSCLE
jgi:outer membrane protein assembly factor BamB